MVYNHGGLVMGKDGELHVGEGEENKFRVYEGQWENDFKHGKGMEKFANGTLF